MAGLLRKLFESVVYAGLRPGGAAPVKAPRRGLRAAWDALLAGRPQADPLYLSNRTWQQKLRVWTAVGVPILAVLAVAVYTMVRPPAATDQRPSDLTPAEIAARTAILPENFRLPQSNELQIVSVSVDRGSVPHQITGAIKNTSGHGFRAAEITFDLTDEEGSQLGGATTRVENIPPYATAGFRFPIPQRNAALVLVREVRPAR